MTTDNTAAEPVNTLLPSWDYDWYSDPSNVNEGYTEDYAAFAATTGEEYDFRVMFSQHLTERDRFTVTHYIKAAPQLLAAVQKAERLLTFMDGSGNNDPIPDRAYVSQVRREFLSLIEAATEVFEDTSDSDQLAADEASEAILTQPEELHEPEQPADEPAADDDSDEDEGANLYAVTIKATVTKTLKVRADSESEANEKAHQEFNPNNDGHEENYEQDTESTELLEGDDNTPECYSSPHKQHEGVDRCRYCGTHLPKDTD